MEHLQYPVGKFTFPAHFDAQEIEQWIMTLEHLPQAVAAEALRFDERMLNTPYRPGGWTARQVFHHIPDSHMNAYIRFKLALTEDQPAIRPYQEAKWAELPDTTHFHISGSVELLRNIHARWVTLLRAMGPADFRRTYFHPENKRTFTLAEALCLYEWHSRHHLEHLRLIHKN